MLISWVYMRRANGTRGKRPSAKTSDIDGLEIGVETARRYLAMRKEVDEMLWQIASLAGVLAMLREIPGPIEMDNHAIGRVGLMIEGNAYDVLDQLNNRFASTHDVGLFV